MPHDVLDHDNSAVDHHAEIDRAQQAARPRVIAILDHTRGSVGGQYRKDVYR
jgi:hypothetical protein